MSDGRMWLYMTCGCAMGKRNANELWVYLTNVPRRSLEFLSKMTASISPQIKSDHGLRLVESKNTSSYIYSSPGW